MTSLNCEHQPIVFPRNVRTALVVLKVSENNVYSKLNKWCRATLALAIQNLLPTENGEQMENGPSNLYGSWLVPETKIRAPPFLNCFIQAKLCDLPNFCQNLWHLHYAWTRCTAVQANCSPVYEQLYSRTWHQPGLSRGLERK